MSTPMSAPMPAPTSAPMPPGPPRGDAAAVPGAAPRAKSRTSLALDNLRGYVVVMVVAFHSVMPYMGSAPPAVPPFDLPPYGWRAHPIVDPARWWGFDLFGAFQFLHLMQLMFFLSGLFVWPSLVRKGAGVFLRDRVLRLGVPFGIGVFALVPLAYFPVYRLAAADPGWPAFWAHYRALPFWPTGPMWFLWFLLLLNLAAAGIGALAPQAKGAVARLSAHAGRRPERFFAGLVIVSALVYLPLARVFPPWHWISFGPFEIQASLAPQYAVYFCAGVTVGAGGLERGILGADGALARRWAVWLAGALAAFALWITGAALIATARASAASAAGLAREAGVVLFAATACFAAIAAFLRFATVPRPILRSLADNAFGIYVFHYVFVIWTQYALLRLALPAVAKGALVLGVALASSWAVSAGVGRLAFGARLLRGERRTVAARVEA